jgi:hypothetical protein
MSITSESNPTASLDELYIHASTEKGNISRKLKQMLYNLQTKYNKDPDGTLAYLNDLSAGVRSNTKKKPPKNMNKNPSPKIEFLGECDLNQDIFCLKCKNKTKNKSGAKVYNTGKNIRVECECNDCGGKKSKYCKRDDLPENLKK